MLIETGPYSELRVLVVDDAPFMIRMISRILRQLGVRDIYEANDGAPAIDMLKYHRNIDLVLCDLEMPEMDGLEFVKTVRSGSGVPNPRVPVIMLSKHAWEEPVKEAISLGVNGFLAKPTTPKALSAQITSVLKTQSSTQEEKT